MRAALLALPLLAGCTVAQVSVGVEACPPGTGPATVVEAFLGRSHAGREVVGEAEWARFMDEIVTPAFPDGLTVLDAAGQWRGRDGRVARERSKLLLVALPGATATEAVARLAPLRAEYRRRFAQESVMVTTRPACLGF
jgi:hypothetical protein